MKQYLSILAVSFAACGTSPEPSRSEGIPPPDLLATYIDSTVKPGDDFFRWATGTWMKNNPIPASESSWSMGHLVFEDLYAIKRRINETAVANPNVEGDEKKVADFWLLAMDSVKADKEGTTPLNAELALIDGIQSPSDAITVAGQLNPIGGDAFWALYIGQDEKNSEKIAVQLWQSGIGLPDRDYYFNKEEGVAKNRAAYPGHIARMLMLTGQDSAAAYKSGADIMGFETRLANMNKRMEDLRDPYANYNKMAVSDFSKTHTPHINWRAMLDSYGLQGCDTLIIGQPDYYSALDKEITSADVNTLKNYMRFHLVSSYARYLSTTISQENFAFFGTELNGRKEQRPRWKRALDAQEGAIGMILGKVYARDYFPAKTKKRYNDLVEAIRTTYGEHIQALDWMSAPTKAKAMEKLTTMTKKVGYPDVWKDMSDLAIGTESYAANMRSSIRWHFNDDVKKFGKPVDRAEWGMTPQTYNAYYNPSNNEIVLPAGIFLIAGLPDQFADDALVYGYAAASTIGHEITHGFDDQGRQYDAKGNLTDWWTPEDAANFKSRAGGIVRQFSGYEPIKGIHVNGDATQGENIADLGGVVLGLDAFKKTEQYKKGEKIAGLTPVQRYFLGYALGWLGHENEESLRQQLLSDVHSPASLRVNGPFANLPEFYEAFGIKEGDAMWRADSLRVKIW